MIQNPRTARPRFPKLLAAAQLPLKDNLSLGISIGLDANPILDRMT